MACVEVILERESEKDAPPKDNNNNNLFFIEYKPEKI